MEIIKRGERPEDKVYDGKCTHCKTEVRFKASEARSSHYPRDGALLVVTCPVCDRDIYVNAR